MRGCRLLGMAAAVAATMLAAGCSGHSSGPVTHPAPHRLADCGGTPQVRPDVVVVRCADNSLVARNLKWSGWGTPVATAAGAGTVNLCEFTDCHTGSYAQFPLVVVLSGALRCPKGGLAYARIQYVFVGHFDAWPASITHQIVARPCGNVPPAPEQEASIPPAVLK